MEWKKVTVFPWLHILLVFALLIVLQFWDFGSIDGTRVTRTWDIQQNVYKSETGSGLLEMYSEIGTNPCANESTTATTYLVGIQNVLRTGVHHTLLLLTYDNAGKRRCCGGDFYETALEGPDWLSRPPIKDAGNGSYAIELFVDPRFPGLYSFKVILLFDNFRGLQPQPEKWVYDKVVTVVQIEFVSNEADEQADNITICKHGDFEQNEWHGRWLRTKSNKKCQLDAAGRYRCFNGSMECDEPWCYGKLSSLESNGWVYSADCGIKIFNSKEAWDCLAGRRVFFWGDSNHMDTIRNLLTFVMGIELSLAPDGFLPRSFNTNFSNPSNASQSVRISSIFNGHHDENSVHIGLVSMHNPEFRKKVFNMFKEGDAPDFVILNSGLHDGMHGGSVNLFAENARNVSEFWKDLWESSSQKSMMIYRSTVTAAGHNRRSLLNPQKLEAFNKIFVEELKKKIWMLKIVDAFDMTFPWHYDYKCSDGVHYGRPPVLAEWFGNMGHFYFVDLMMAHTLLNTMCPI